MWSILISLYTFVFRIGEPGSTTISKIRQRLDLFRVPCYATAVWICINILWESVPMPPVDNKIYKQVDR